MKTFQIRSLQIIATIAMMFFIGSSVLANVKVYQYSSYKGKAIECGPGEHARSKFSKLFYKTAYCSIKVPNGYVVDVDYYGRGWRKGTYKTYSSSIGRLSSKFKNIRIRKAGGNTPVNGKPVYGAPDCGNDWVVRLYQSTSYKGKYLCYPLGKHKYSSSTFRGYPQSIKVKPGYRLLLMNRGRQVKEITGSASAVRVPQFDLILLKTIDSKPIVKPVEQPGCGSDWVVKFYQSSNYKGKYLCYSEGKYSYRNTAFRGSPQSIKVKSGYRLLLMSRGRQVKEITGSASALRLPQFDRLLMEKLVKAPSKSYKGRSGSNANTSSNTSYNRRTPGNITRKNRNRDSGVEFYSHESYQGQQTVYGTGRFKETWTGAIPKSVKVKQGYELVLYRDSRVLNIVVGSFRRLNVQFNKFELRPIVYQEANGLNCGSIWAIQFCSSKNFQGSAYCYGLGKHSFKVGSGGYPNSIQVKRGYYMVLKYQGKVVVVSPRSIPNTRFRFDEIIITRDKRYLSDNWNI